MAKKAKNERHRLLRIIAKESVHLEIPLRMPDLRELLSEGKIEERRHFHACWGNKDHECVELAITSIGRKELSSYETLSPSPTGTKE